jgi:hypothetical protein
MLYHRWHRRHALLPGHSCSVSRSRFRRGDSRGVCNLVSSSDLFSPTGPTVAGSLLLRKITSTLTRVVIRGRGQNNRRGSDVSVLSIRQNTLTRISSHNANEKKVAGGSRSVMAQKAGHGGWLCGEREKGVRTTALESTRGRVKYRW